MSYSKMDVLGLGCVAIDDLFYVDAYPPADSKQEVRRRERRCGGLTATALVAAARLGIRAAYAGTLGNDPQSQFALATLDRAGVDIRHVRIQEGARPIHSTIIVDVKNHTRNIFYSLEGVSGPDASWPPEELIRHAEALFVDHFGANGMLRAAQVAREAGRPVVADFERSDVPQFNDLLDVVDHLILSRNFALDLTNASSSDAAVRKLWHADRCIVVVTAGAEGCWFACDKHSDAGQTVHHYPAFDVPAINTNGCGDVFHGAYVAALVRGEGISERISFASAAAALMASRQGRQADIPTRSEVATFLEQRS